MSNRSRPRVKTIFLLCISSPLPKGNGQARKISLISKKITKWVKLAFCSSTSSPPSASSFLLSHQMHFCFTPVTLDQPSTRPRFNFLPLQESNLFLASYILLNEEVWNPNPSCLASHVVDKELWRTHFYLFTQLDIFL